MRFRRTAICLSLLLLAACKPPAADEYVERTRIAGRSDAPAPPIASPDTEGAVWAPASGSDARLLYGKPGEQPLFSLECARAQVVPTIAYTRYAPADARAKAVLALIGNGHVKRVKVDATRVGDAWLWRGALPASDPAFDVLTGAREVEATIPGAGSLVLNPSQLPGQLVDSCRALAEPAPVSAPASPAPPADPA